MTTAYGISQSTLDVLQKYNFRFQKKYGQNFLIDGRILDEIMEAADITEEDFVLEIGPGIGTMTRFLAERARRVLAVEIDGHLIPILKEELSDYENIEILHKDILKTNLCELAEIYNESKPVKVVANLPYYITTPIIMELFESHAPIESIVVDRKSVV